MSMKYAVLLAAGAALTLCACQNSEQPAPEATEAATPDAPDAAAAAAPAGPATFAAGAAPSKEFMVGTWGEGDACEQPINFQADGTIKDGPFPTWDLQDGQLTMGDMVKLTLTVVDDKTMESRMEGSDEATILKRCG
jgi:hypothetical protein